MRRIIVLFCLSFIYLQSAEGQSPTVIKGKVTEAATGNPIPFANVIIKGTTIGITTDFEGNYKLTTTEKADSVQVSYIGYVPKTKAVERGKVQSINFMLEESLVSLPELVVKAGENPAHSIMRKVIKHKKNNDKRKFSAYEFEAYSKIEMDLDNISEKLKKNKFVQKVTSVLDSVHQVQGDDGQPILPVFISEAISRFYFRENPLLTHEKILNTKISGVGVTDGSVASQIIGASFRQYNFYENWLTIIGKDFVSPIADGWKINYNFELADSLNIGNFYCYKLDFYPKRAQDLAFSGTMWIDKDTWAIKQIDIAVGKEANINYVEKIKIQQELEPTPEGPWLPVKTRVLVDLVELGEESVGFLAKFYMSNKDFVVNNPQPIRFYEEPIELAEGMTEEADNEEFWAQARHDSLSRTEAQVYELVDTLANIPVIKTATDLIETAFTGYYKVGKLDIGPYSFLFGRNNIEGFRVGFGARTNADFSKEWELSAHAARGFKDHRWKYKFHVRRILNRSPWTEVKYLHQKEIDQVWLLTSDISSSSFFYTFSRFGKLLDPFLRQKNEISFSRVISRGLVQEVTYRHEELTPQFDFVYFKNSDTATPASHRILTVGELVFNTRFAKDEVFLINGNRRVSKGARRWPVMNLRYTLGHKALGGSFNYHKLAASIEKKQKMGIFGTGNLVLGGEYMFNDVPYPLLKSHVGNETPFRFDFAYNLMDCYEFVTDKYLAFRWDHSFEGFLVNSIPLITKLKWRLTGTLNMLYGTARESHFSLTPKVFDTEGKEIKSFSSLGKWPYIEASYGVENIFRLLRVDFIHRLTHPKSVPQQFAISNNFSIKLSFRFIL